ncbi:unnamed protein product [Gongylonema pulchrum]|uniref:non-specific serine/threonine protein kinase n=1 Tax=Gongylonema pulchrum TaxID=637853 RepID=A0A183EC59_9BILA|nr:unnamed protein product [Gongylonema pulchrum]
MPDIGTVDVQACRNALAYESPTELLLSIWGSKGNTVIQLYNCLARAKLVRAMKVLHCFVDARYHRWEWECLQLNEEDNRRMLPDTATSPAGSDGIVARCFDEPSSWMSAKPDRPGWLHPESSDFTESRVIYSTLQNTPCISYSEIAKITSSFCANNIIGKGGYGTIYKATWEQTEVAVKRIQASDHCGSEKEQISQSLQELRTLSKYRHDNILPLYAYSLDGPEPCLLYQYMANGSLFDFAVKPIIHGDVKSANILLDKYFEPKLGDFGLCRDHFSKDESHDGDFLIASSVKGTLAYLPREFLTDRIVSPKIDVYGYGVVLLEVATELKAHVSNREPQNLVEYITTSGESLEDMKEKQNTLTGANSMYFELLLNIGLKCVVDDYSKRPPFSEIIDMLLSVGSDARCTVLMKY